MKVPREVGKHTRDKVYAENDPYMPPKGKGLVGVAICRIVRLFIIIKNGSSILSFTNRKRN